MSTKPKTPPTGGSTGGNAAPNEPREYRVNVELDGKIDAYIKENPKYWEYLQSTPKDRLQRMLVLKEVQALDRQQRIKESLMKEIEKKPELKQAYEVLLKNVPEDLRDGVMVRIAQQARRAVNRGQRQTAVAA